MILARIVIQLSGILLTSVLCFFITLQLGQALLIPPTYISPRAADWSLPARFTSVDDFGSAIKVKDWKWGKENCGVQTASRKQKRETETDIEKDREIDLYERIEWIWKTSASNLNKTEPSSQARELPSPLLGYDSQSHQDRNANERKKRFAGEPTGSDSILSISIPAGSVGSGGGGGTGFYALPIDMTQATQVQLSYYVFFPSDFEWNRGGKLPGLYGGTEGCSGSNPATDCFSTRMMWRNRGAGELYLYAQRDKQSAAVCKQLAAYGNCATQTGISMGRGSFSFQAGKWNQVHQLIRLNNPGDQDGGFAVWYNGDLVIQAESGVSFRNSGRMGFIGIMGDFFYGGSSADWAPSTDQTIYFSEITISIDR